MSRSVRWRPRKSGQWEAWSKIRRYVKHMRGHRRHFHIRVGDGPGLPGCTGSSHGAGISEGDGDEVGDEYDVDLGESGDAEEGA